MFDTNFCKLSFALVVDFNEQIMCSSVTLALAKAIVQGELFSIPQEGVHKTPEGMSTFVLSYNNGLLQTSPKS